MIGDEERVIGLFQLGTLLHGESVFAALEVNDAVAPGQVRVEQQTVEMLDQRALEIVDVAPSSCGRMAVRKLPSTNPAERGE